MLNVESLLVTIGVTYLTPVKTVRRGNKMKCPECGYESPWGRQVISRSEPCIACGYDMDGVEFYNEASATFVVQRVVIVEKPLS